MNWLSNLSVKFKILLIPILSILGFLTYLGFNVVVNTGNAKQLDEIEATYFPQLELSKSAVVNLDRIVELANNAVTLGETELLNEANELSQKIQTSLDDYQALQPASGGENAISGIKQRLRQFTQLNQELAQGMIDGTIDYERLPDMAQQKNDLLTTLQNNLHGLADASRLQLTFNISDVNETSGNTVMVGGVIAVVTILVMIVISLSVTSNISGNIGALNLSLRDIAQGEGDLTRRLKQTSQDDVGTLVYWFNLFMEKIHTSMSSVMKVVEPMVDVSEKLFALSAKTKSASGDQLKSVQVVSDGVDNMLNHVQEISDYATAATESAKEADAEANKGLQVVDAATIAINQLATEIEHSATIISELESHVNNVGIILDVIRGIAEQTNLLALNAAIEAARAGEQGRGFAVVADEVRTLASRTQDSTQEIHRVIEKLQHSAVSAVKAMQASQKSAQSGVEYSALTGETLTGIAKKVATISSINQKISRSTEAQKSVSQNVYQSLITMKDASHITAENTKVMEDLSTSVKTLGDSLEKVSNLFKV